MTSRSIGSRLGEWTSTWRIQCRAFRNFEPATVLADRGLVTDREGQPAVSTLVPAEIRIIAAVQLHVMVLRQRVGKGPLNDCDSFPCWPAHGPERYVANQQSAPRNPDSTKPTLRSASEHRVEQQLRMPDSAGAADAKPALAKAMA